MCDCLCWKTNRFNLMGLNLNFDMMLVNVVSLEANFYLLDFFSSYIPANQFLGLDTT